MIDFRFTVGKNARGQWVARHEATGNMALLDPEKGLQIKPGHQPSEELQQAFTWMLGMALACDHCTEHEGCAPFKA